MSDTQAESSASLSIKRYERRKRKLETLACFSSRVVIFIFKTTRRGEAFGHGPLFFLQRIIWFIFISPPTRRINSHVFELMDKQGWIVSRRTHEVSVESITRDSTPYPYMNTDGGIMETFFV